VDGDERALLEAAMRGTTLQQLCELAPAESTEEAARQVFQIVARWLADGLVARP
jgi:hypothetical protein